MSARERLLDARLDLGESALLVPELEALVAEDPLREERWRLLVLALYRAQRQADALAALRRARDTLAEALTVDPGPELRTLKREVLSQSPALDGPPVSAEPPSSSPSVAREHPSPAVRADLVDRDHEIRALTQAVDNLLAGGQPLSSQAAGVLVRERLGDAHHAARRSTRHRRRSAGAKKPMIEQAGEGSWAPAASGVTFTGTSTGRPLSGDTDGDIAPNDGTLPPWRGCDPARAP